MLFYLAIFVKYNVIIMSNSRGSLAICRRLTLKQLYLCILSRAEWLSFLQNCNTTVGIISFPFYNEEKHYVLLLDATAKRQYRSFCSLVSIFI